MPGPYGLNTPSAANSSVIVNPLSYLDPFRHMAALSSCGLVNPALSSPCPSGPVNPPSAAGPSHLMAAVSSPGPSWPGQPSHCC